MGRRRKKKRREISFPPSYLVNIPHQHLRLVPIRPIAFSPPAWNGPPLMTSRRTFFFSWMNEREKKKEELPLVVVNENGGSLEQQPRVQSFFLGGEEENFGEREKKGLLFFIIIIFEQLGPGRPPSVCIPFCLRLGERGGGKIEKKKTVTRSRHWE